MKWRDELRRTLGRLQEEKPASACDSTLDCRDAVERIFEYLDGELEGGTREELAEHFRVCGRCYPALAFEESFREALRRVRRDETAPPEVRERILAALDEDDGAPSG